MDLENCSNKIKNSVNEFKNIFKRFEERITKLEHGKYIELRMD